MNYYDILLAKKLEDDRDPRVEGLSVTENGRYAEEGVVYSPVIVSVPEPTLTTKTITSNGTYSATEDNADGYSEVNVDVPLPSNGYLLESASGELVTVSDAGVFPLVSCDVDIEPMQELHGYDNPWVGGVGKNKLPMTLETIKAINGSSTGSWSGNVFTHNYGVKFTVLTDEGGNVTGINANGTATAIAFFNVGVYTPTAGDILNGCPAGGGDSGPYKIMGRSATTSDTGNGIEIVNEVGEETTFRIVIWTGATVTDLKFYPMIRKSTEQSATFAPYTNICPISGYSEVSLNRTGKNLLNGTTSVTIDGTNTITLGSATLPAGTYTFSLKQNNSMTSNTRNTLRVSHGSSTHYESTSTNYHLNAGTHLLTFTLTEEQEVSFWIWGQGLSTATTYSEPQVELGSSATTYEPYQGTSITLSLGSTVYGGSVDLSSGVLTVDRAIMDLGDFDWNYISADKVFYNLMPMSCNYNAGNTDTLCEGFTYDTDANWTTDLSENQYMMCKDLYALNRVSVAVKNTSVTTTDAFKTLVTGIKFVYPLATPTTYQLTPTLIKLLQGINNLYADDCDIAIEYFGKGSNL